MDVGCRTALRLLAVSVCVCAGLGQKPCAWSITQSPDTVKAPLGSSVSFICSFQPPPNVERLRVSWAFANTTQPDHKGAQEVSFSILTDAKTPVSRQYPGGLKQETGPTWSNLSLSHVEESHAAFYFCTVAVEIPPLQECRSNGTQLTVDTITEKNPEGQGSSWWSWIVIAVAVVIIGMVAAATVTRCLTFRRTKRQTEHVDRIYMNTPVRPEAPQKPKGAAHPQGSKDFSALSGQRVPVQGRIYTSAKLRASDCGAPCPLP